MAGGIENTMEYVTLTRLIEKMKLTNLTPEIEVKGIKIRQPDINRPALQMAGYSCPALAAFSLPVDTS